MFPRKDLHSKARKTKKNLNHSEFTSRFSISFAVVSSPPSSLLPQTVLRRSYQHQSRWRGEGFSEILVPAQHSQASFLRLEVLVS